MKIAIVAPSPVPFTIGGAEYLYSGMQNAINNFSNHQCELIKIPVNEGTFWGIIDSYFKFYTLDLECFDLVISTKYPSWMISHPNHILYMVHHLRGLFDTYHFFNKPERTPDFLITDEVIKIVAILRKKDSSHSDVDLFFLHMNNLKKEELKYPGELFEFPGPFIFEIVHFLDNYALSPNKIKKYFTMSENVKQRRDYFPTGVPVSVIYPPPINDSFYCTDYKHLFTASRLDGPKRIDLLIEAMKFVPHIISLKIAGTGPEEKKLRAKAGADNRIEFLGFVNEEQKKELYANALAVVFVPFDEDYGFITIEAMKSQKAVITCTDSGGPLEFVKNCQTGFVTSPDPRLIAERINYFIENKADAVNMGIAANESVKNINWQLFTHKLLNIQGDQLPKKKILVLSTYSCYPPRGGGQQRLYNIYSRLAKKFDIRICSIIESNKSHENLYLENELQQICIPQSLDHAQFQCNEEKKLGKNLYDCCMIDFVEKSPQYINEVKKQMIISDIIIFSHPYLFPLSKHINTSSKVIYDAIDVEYLQKKSYVNNNWNTKLFSNEKNCCDFSNLIFTTSEEDKTNLLELYNLNPEKIAVAPNGVDTLRIQYISDSERIKQKNLCNLENTNTVLFVGSWHPPNLEALKFIIKDLLPGLNNTKLLLVGSIKDNYLFEVGNLPDNVLAFGVVDELEKYEIYKLADIAINPMFSGSGTNIKMLDYFSAGIPVVTTETGARGLMIEHNNEAIICSPETMLQSILQLINDQKLQDKLKKNARTLVESAYSWDRIVNEIENYIEKI
jgi:glycosyltransferase involved in cell wall biosynthesis